MAIILARPLKHSIRFSEAMSARFPERAYLPEFAYLFALGWIVLVFLQPPQLRAQDADYVRDIKPIFKERCWSCHGALKQEAGLRLDTARSILEANAIVPRSPAESQLLARIASNDLASRMPPEGHPLSTDQVAVVRLWIELGAPAPEDEAPESAPEQHWSFQVPVAGTVPNVHGVPASQVIDAFLLSKLHEAGLQPAPLAEREVWLRRVTLDLTGVPPTLEEIGDFLADSSADAYERVVDRLLSSPRYGERWGRHWMDVWRYADWFGRRSVPDVWNSAPQIWRWRDWIVRSLNEDAGYDRMIASMLAADEIDPGNPNEVVATGFLVRNWYALNPNDWMRNIVEHSSKAFLGLTIQCAHCHDHKYDPIRQEDYFAMRAFFEPIYVRQDRLAGQADPGPFQDYQYSTQRIVQRLGYVSVFDKDPDAPTWFYASGDERNRDEGRGAIAPDVPDFLKNIWLQEIPPVELPAAAWYPGLHPDVQSAVLMDIDQELQKANKELALARDEQILWDSDPNRTKEQDAIIARWNTAQQALDAYVCNNGVRNNGVCDNGVCDNGVCDNGVCDNGVHSSQDASTSLEKRRLVLDARKGRRMIYHSLRDVPPLGPGSTVEFRISPFNTSHVNVQLTRDNVQGLTATFVGFENGAIRAYRPGTFEEFEVIALNREIGTALPSLSVRLELDRKRDQGLLNIKHSDSEKWLVSEVPIALHGWDPATNPAQGILIDARRGAWASIDELAIHAEDGSAVARWDWETDGYQEGMELAGREGWNVLSSYCEPGGLSIISSKIPDPTREQLHNALATADRARNRMMLKVDAAVAKVDWLQARVADWHARTQAEQYRYRSDQDVSQEKLLELARGAHQAQHRLKQRESRWQYAHSLSHLAQLEALPSDTADLAAKVEAASAELHRTTHAWEIAGSEECDPLADTYEPLSRQYPRTSTGRRTALATWITNPRNPLTARVAVNHLWMRHFHQPLVASVFDFGRNGAQPSHPELLDWLAVEFMESGWSMKHIHRLIVTSDAYRRVSSSREPKAFEIDPENRLLWRMNTGRLESESLRDSILAIAGKLDAAHGGQELENNQSLTTHRRSIYYSCQPEDDGKSPLGAIFDGPDANECYRRTRTIVPQQSLALTNSEWIHGLSDAILEQIDAPKSDSAKEEHRFVQELFLRILGRQPREAELRMCVEYLASEGKDSRASLIRVLLNHNDFVTIR